MILADVLAGTALVKTEFDDTRCAADLSGHADITSSPFAPFSRDLEDLEVCEGDADGGHQRIEELVRTGEERASSRFWSVVCDADGFEQ